MQKEVNPCLEELCKLVSEVGNHFNNKFSSDCFCGFSSTSKRPIIEGEVIFFIRQAIKEKIAKEGITK